MNRYYGLNNPPSYKPQSLNRISFHKKINPMDLIVYPI